MELQGAEMELERRSKFLNSLIQKKKATEELDLLHLPNIRVRASDMPVALQNKAFRCAQGHLDSMPNKKIDSKSLALALKKVGPSSSLQANNITYNPIVWYLDTAATHHYTPSIRNLILEASAYTSGDLVWPGDDSIVPILRHEFDTSYGPAWHCIVGTSFGSYVTHSLGGFLYFSIDKVYILLFKTAVEPLGH